MNAKSHPFGHTFLRSVARPVAIFLISILSAASLKAQGGGGINEFGFLGDEGRQGLFHSADFDGDGFRDMIILKNGELAVGYGHANVSVRGWDYLTKQKVEGVVRPSSIESHDLDGDGREDIIVTSYSQNSVTLIWGQSSRTAPLRVEEFEVGPGPLLAHAVPGVLIGRSQTRVTLLAPIAATDSPLFRLFDPLRATLTNPIDEPWDTADDEPGLPGVSISLDLDGSFHTMGTVQGKAFAVHRIEKGLGGLSGVHKVGDVTLKRGYVSSRDMWPDRLTSGLHFVNFAPGLDTLELVGLNTATSVPEVDDEVVVGFLVGEVKILPAAVRDQLLVISQDGLRASIFEYNPPDGLRLIQDLPTVPGQSFETVVPVEIAGTMHLFLTSSAGGNFGPGSYRVYSQNALGQFEIAVTDLALPLLPIFPPTSTIALKTGDPFTFSSSTLFDFEFLAAGNFSTMASFGGGQVTATVETFLGSAQGLGMPEVLQVQPDDDPGAAGTAVPNSWEVSSSLSYEVPAGGGGLAAVDISPPPGTYGGVVDVSFSPAPGTAVVSRIAGGPWQSGNGPYPIAADSTVEFYGEHFSGSISPIQSASYDIEIPPDQDSDNDGILDLLAASLGLDPAGGGNGDGDDFSDLEELLNNSDPNDPASIPASLDTPFPPSLEAVVETTLPDPVGSAILAPALTEVRLFSSLGRDMTGGRLNNQGRVNLELPGYFNRAVQGEPPLREDAVLFVAWHHDELPGADYAALLGVGLPGTLALPAPPAPPGVPLPYPVFGAALIDEWLADTRTIIGGFKSMSGMTSETEVVEVSIETTVTALAYATWVRDRLDMAGRGRPAFPWDDSEFGLSLSAADLAFLEAPQGPQLLAFELTHVVQQLHDGISENLALAPLVQMAREIYLSWEFEFVMSGDPGRPVIIGNLPNPVSAIGQFFEKGVIDPAYASVVTTPVGELVSLRDTLLAIPPAREVLEISGILTREPGTGSWVVQEDQTGVEFLLQRADRSAVVDDSNTITMGYRPFRFPFGADPFVGAAVEMVGFPTGPVGQMQGLIAFLAPSLEHTLATLAPNDSDFDGIDDEYELRYLGNLDAGFWDDSDGDGFVNGREYRESRRAGDPSSFPAGDPAMPRQMDSRFEGNELVIEWNGSGAATYVVAFTTDGLGVFTPSPQAPEQPQLGVPFYRWTYEITGQVPSIFFRVETTLKEFNP